jgi:hypothetical protein
MSGPASPNARASSRAGPTTSTCAATSRTRCSRRDAAIKVSPACAKRAAIVEQDAPARDDPFGKATQGGRQTGELDPAGHPALLALESLQLDLSRAPAPEGVDDGDIALRIWDTRLTAGGARVSLAFDAVFPR